MRAYIYLVLLFVNTISGFTSKQVMDRLNYVEDRLNAESKFRREDFNSLFEEVSSIKTMLQQVLEEREKGKDTVRIQIPDETYIVFVEKVSMLVKAFKEEKKINMRFRREIPDIQRHVQILTTKTEQIATSLEDVAKRLESLNLEHAVQTLVETTKNFDQLQKQIPMIQGNIFNLEKQSEQNMITTTETLASMTHEMKELQENQEQCLETININNNLTKTLTESLNSGELYCILKENDKQTDDLEKETNCSATSSDINSTTTTSSEIDSTTTTSSDINSTTTTSSEIDSTTTTSSDIDSTTTTSSDINSTTTTSSEIDSTTTTSSDIDSTTTTSSDIDSTTTTSSDIDSTTTTSSDIDSSTTKYKSCQEFYDNGHKLSDVYEIEIDPERTISVYCDMITDGGGWTVFQRRQDGSVDFYRNWDDYKAGFGDLNGEFWLGNDYLNILTDTVETHELRVDLEDYDGNRAFAKYSRFKVRSESENFKLEVSGYTGDAGDSLENPSRHKQVKHNGMEFTTKDRDNDKYSSGNCAVGFQGAWWYNHCFESNLNSLYHEQSKCKTRWFCIVWNTWKGYRYSMKFTEMKFRKV